MASKKCSALKCDKPFIEAFNNNLAIGKANHIIRLDVIPEPFLGNPNADVIYLSLNPGYKEEEVKFHKQRDFREKLLKTIKKPENHFYLANEFNCKGRKWWEKALRGVAVEKKRVNPKWGPEEIRNNYRIIAKNLFCIEYFPYHSKKFAHGALRLPSQGYSFHLVRQAIERGACIICARGKEYWLGAIPELTKYKNLFYLKNPRASSISRDNLMKGSRFNKIKKMLLKKR